MSKKNLIKNKKRFIYKSAATGLFVTGLYFLRHPLTTYLQRVK